MIKIENERFKSALEDVVIFIVILAAFWNLYLAYKHSYALGTIISVIAFVGIISYLTGGKDEKRNRSKKKNSRNRKHN